MRAFVFLVVSMLVCVSVSSVAEAQIPSIERLRGDIYRVQDSDQVTVFVATPEGILVVDPISQATAQWLSAEFATRFPGRLVRYVVYSRHDADRSGGASLFGSATEVVGHRAFNAKRNAAARATRDANYQYVLPAESDYVAQRTIRLGTKEVVLLHPGDAYGEDFTVVHFPAESLVFGAFLPSPRTLPSSLVSPTAKVLASSLRQIEALDFDVFVNGRGEQGTKQDLAQLRQYVEEIVASVRTGFTKKETVSRVQSATTLNGYASWTNYDQRAAHIAQVYARMRRLDIGIFGGGVQGYVSRGTSCDAEPLVPGERVLACTTPGGTSPGPLVGVMVVGRRYGVHVEYSRGREVTGGRTQTQFPNIRFDFPFRHHDSVLSVLPSVQFGGSAVTVTLLAGAAMVHEISEEQMTRPPIVVPNGPPIQITYYTAVRDMSGLSWVAGANLNLGRTLGVVLPVRVIRAPRAPFTPFLRYSDVGPWILQAGVTIKANIFHHIR